MRLMRMTVLLGSALLAMGAGKAVANSSEDDECLAKLESVESDFGADTLTYDPCTGLDWLDLAQTAGVGRVELESGMGAGGTFEGFRLPTYAEVDEFLGNGGLPSLSDMTSEEWSPDFQPQVEEVGQLLGATATIQESPSNPGSCPQCPYSKVAFSFPSIPPNDNCSSGAGFRTVRVTLSWNDDQADVGKVGTFCNDDFLPHLLVTVPEANGPWMTMAAVSSLGAIRLRRRLN